MKCLGKLRGTVGLCGSSRHGNGRSPAMARSTEVDGVGSSSEWRIRWLGKLCSGNKRAGFALLSNIRQAVSRFPLIRHGYGCQAEREVNGWQSVAGCGDDLALVWP